MSMLCDYRGCFECFMRDHHGPVAWVVTRWEPDGEPSAWTNQPADPFELRSMWLNRKSNDRRYFNARGEVRR